MITSRNHSVDAVKGALIFLVVLGHVLLGTLDEKLARYVIYSFHMPVFFFVSGYLLNIEKLRAQRYSEMFGKYWHRMLLEWFVAWIIYTAFVMHNDFSLAALAHNIYNPYYHLWFVPSLFVMVSIVWLTVRKINDDFLRLSLLMTFGILFYNLSNTDFKLSGAVNCACLPFLALGVIARNKMNLFNISGGVNVGVYIVLIVIFRTFVDNTPIYYSTYFKLPFLFMLCLYGFLPIMQRQRFHNSVLEFWGRQSLHIYLWHVIPILGLKWLFSDNETLYYIFSFSLFAVSFIATELYLKYPALKKRK